jgi:phosphoglycolate phosphatase
MTTDTFDAVLFDLDGTLLDTLRDIGQACNRALVERGYPPHPIEAYRYFVGDGARVLLSRALPEGHRDEATIDACLADYLAAYAGGWNVHTQPYAGISDMLDALIERGLKLAVLSNKPHPFTVQCVETFLARWTFHAVRGQTDAFPRKPGHAHRHADGDEGGNGRGGGAVGVPRTRGAGGERRPANHRSPARIALSGSFSRYFGRRLG